jgi:hypothetical protein
MPNAAPNKRYFGSRLGTLAEAEAAGPLEGKRVFSITMLLTRAEEVID